MLSVAGRVVIDFRPLFEGIDRAVYYLAQYKTAVPAYERRL